VSKKLTAIILGVFVLALALAGCGGQADQKQAAKPKVLKVGTEPSFAPFEFQEEGSKEYTGFDMDLIRAVGKQMGYEVQIVSMGFDGLIPALESGQIDAVASGMSITEERAKKVTFSKPYYKSGLTMVIKSDNNSIKTFKDLEGKSIGVQIGTTGAEEARKIKDAKIREFNTPPEAFMELKNNGVDAVVNDLPVNEYFIAKTGAKDVKLAGEVQNAENYGIAIAKKNTELSEKVNKALDDIKANGEYEKIYMKWFNKKP